MNKITIVSAALCFTTSFLYASASEINNSHVIDLTQVDATETLEDYWRLVQHSKPGFPAKARRKGLSGCVDLKVRVDGNGRGTGYKIITSYPEGVFDDKAVLALDKWRWSPTASNKERTPVLTTVQLDFRLIGSRNEKQAQANCKYAQ